MITTHSFHSDVTLSSVDTLLHTVYAQFIGFPGGTASKEVLQNYRPVSNLAFLPSKVLERVVCARLREYLTVNCLLKPHQSTYRANYSTETVLLRVQSNLLMAVDEGCATFLVLLGLLAAFDTIDHGILLTHLQSWFNTGGVALDWLASYLSDHVQQVNIKGVLSIERELLLGVPWGSVLGPLLFSLYTAPISEIVDWHGVSIHFYADDTQLYPSFMISSTDEIPQILLQTEMCITEIHAWMLQNKLMINDLKTEFIVIVSPQQEGKFTIPGICVGNSLIPPTSHVCNVGVVFDKHLNMWAQVNNICHSVHVHLCNIGRVRSMLPQEAMQRLIHAFITSHIDCCNALLYGVSQSLPDKLQRILNSATRILMLTPKFLHMTRVCRELHWLPVSARVDYKILVLMCKALHGLTSQYLHSLLQWCQPGSALHSGHSSLLCVPNTRLRMYGDRAFPHTAPILWNLLRPAAHWAPSLALFKTFLFDKSYT